MGKIRVKTIGIEEEENKDKKKLKERNDAKKAEAAKRKAEAGEVAEPAKEASPAEEETTDKKADKKVKKTSKYKAKNKKNSRSASYVAIAKLIDKNKKYALKEALGLLPQLKRAKFDETVELHINTTEKGVSGQVTLKHGTGKKAKIEIADVADDPKHVEELVKKVAAGQIDFDILIATPETMPKLAAAARFLGPRGLMPNPKNGTIHPKPKEAIKKFEGGQINFKTEAKASIIHLSVGKLSFGDEKLADNINAVIGAVQTKNIQSVTLKSTMSPGIGLSL